MPEGAWARGRGGRVSSSSGAACVAELDMGAKGRVRLSSWWDVQPRKRAGSRADCEPRGWQSSQAAVQGPGDGVASAGVRLGVEGARQGRGGL